MAAVPACIQMPVLQRHHNAEGEPKSRKVDPIPAFASRIHAAARKGTLPISSSTRASCLRSPPRRHPFTSRREGERSGTTAPHPTPRGRSRVRQAVLLDDPLGDRNARVARYVPNGQFPKGDGQHLGDEVAAVGRPHPDAGEPALATRPDRSDRGGWRTSATRRESLTDERAARVILRPHRKCRNRRSTARPALVGPSGMGGSGGRRSKRGSCQRPGEVAAAVLGALVSSTRESWEIEATAA